MAAVLAVPPPMVWAQDTTLSAGLDYTTGDYGLTRSTDIRVLSLNLKHETGPFIYRVAVPHVRITGPANVVAAGEEPLPLPGEAPRRTESGLGDVVASAFYNLLSGRDTPFLLDLGAKIKLGTGDETRGLGTGEHDVSLQLDALRTYGRFTPFATLGHRWYGDPPGLALRDVFYASIGTAYRVDDDTSAGLAYDTRDRIVRGGARVSELLLFGTRKLSGTWRAQLYGIVGFSDASPDWGAGAVLSYGF